MALTPQQERFAQEYILDLNGTQAAARAGYSPKTANEQAGRLLANVSVRTRIKELQAERAGRSEVNADRVLTQLARLAFGDLRSLFRDDGTLKDPKEWSDDAAALVGSVETEEEVTPSKDGKPPVVTRTRKVKRIDPNRALELLCKHLGMITDRLSVTTPPGSGLDLSLLSDDVKRSLLAAFRANDAT